MFYKHLGSGFSFKIFLTVMCVASVFGIFLLIAYTTTFWPVIAQQLYEISIGENGYNPAELVVPTGSVVRWTNLDNNIHTVTSVTGLFDSLTLNSGNDFAFTFNEPGVFEYFDNESPSYKGRIIVK